MYIKKGNLIFKTEGDLNSLKEVPLIFDTLWGLNIEELKKNKYSYLQTY